MVRLFNLGTWMMSNVRPDSNLEFVKHTNLNGTQRIKHTGMKVRSG